MDQSVFQKQLFLLIQTLLMSHFALIVSDSDSKLNFDFFLIQKLNHTQFSVWIRLISWVSSRAKLVFYRCFRSYVLSKYKFVNTCRNWRKLFMVGNFPKLKTDFGIFQFALDGFNHLFSFFPDLGPLACTYINKL